LRDEAKTIALAQLAINPESPRLGMQHAEDSPQQRGFPLAIRPQEEPEFPGMHDQIDLP